ncbi:hypothetical protein Acr_26g0005990 [Actinidia rufa]|uniref:Uncharacterized protein n=1 Tax=Actinidia rufa TaxID=165716 RepID=A0A7J0H2P6_9ERIC|nr:hypothetical protein Acr_26g0005990 [Actinidia rufa]
MSRRRWRVSVVDLQVSSEVAGLEACRRSSRPGEVRSWSNTPRRAFFLAMRHRAFGYGARLCAPYLMSPLLSSGKATVCLAAPRRAPFCAIDNHY